MLSIVIGTLLLIAGLFGIAAAVGGIDWAAARWPRPFTPSDVHQFESSGFLVAFVSLLLVAAGAGMIGFGLFTS